jgi:signal transduction histidine kinase
MIRYLRSPFAKFGLSVLVLSGLAMLLMPGLVGALFSPGQFMPHVHCYLDDPRMVWLQGLSDFLIGLSYMMISGALAYLVYRARKDVPFEWMFLAFGIFIFSCGWTHFLEVWTLYHPTYWLSGAVKAITAVASLGTAIGVFYLIPHVFRLIQIAKTSENRRQELIKKNAELEQAYHDLETFSYSLSHDVRGPLRAINGFSQMVLEDHREKLAGEGEELMQRVVSAAQRMDRLVNDVLALSRLSQTEVRPERVDLESTLEMILRGRPDLQPPKAEIHISKPLLPVTGDQGSLAQCLENLLGNAVKFVNPGSKPQVRISTHSVGDRVRIWIEDNGIGIPPEGVEKIFKPFQRLHRQEDYEGTGIGLAIVQKAVQRMGGAVGVESEVGKGSRFWVELPSA